MPFMTDGVYVEGTRYQFLRVLDDKFVLAKKKKAEHCAYKQL